MRTLLAAAACLAVAAGPVWAAPKPLRGKRVCVLGPKGYEGTLAERTVHRFLQEHGATVLETPAAAEPADAPAEVGKKSKADLVFIAIFAAPRFSNRLREENEVWVNDSIVFSGELIDVRTGASRAKASATGVRGQESEAVRAAVGQLQL